MFMYNTDQKLTPDLFFFVMKITILKVHYHQYASCKKHITRILLKTHALLALDNSQQARVLLHYWQLINQSSCNEFSGYFDVKGQPFKCVL